MPPTSIRHRRGRRTDFVAILGILAASGCAVPAPDRAALRRFRRMVADLGSDLYVALLDERVAGFVYVTYTRDIALGTRGRIEALVVAPDARRRGVGASLAALARRRAAGRGCCDLRCAATASMAAARRLFAREGWQPLGEEYQFDLVRGAQ